MRRLLVAAATLVLAVPTQIATATTAPIAPPRVHDLAAFQLSTPVHLQWTTPTGIDRVVARIARGRTAPATPQQGRAISLDRIRASRATLSRLAAGTVYSATVWTQRNGLLSRPTTTTFTTRPAHRSAGPSAAVEGIVTDAAGHPLSGARVYAVGMSVVNPPRPVVTPSNGRFSVRVPAGASIVGADGSRAAGGSSDRTGYGFDVRDLTLAAGRTIHVHLVLPTAGALHGTVTDPAGHPLSGVRVMWQPPQPYLQDQSGSGITVVYDDLSTARTGPRGRYTLKGMPATAAVVCFEAAGAVSLRQRCTAQSFAAAPGHTVTVPPTVLASAPGGSIDGLVTTESGRPVRGVFLELNRVHGHDYSFARSDGTGHFDAPDLAPGRWSVCSTPGLFASRGLGTLATCVVVPVVSGRPTHAVLRMPRGGALSGRLLGPSGRGVPGAVVTVVPVPDRGFGSLTRTDHEGYFMAGGLRTGNYKLCAQGVSSAAPGDPTGVEGRCFARVFHVVVGRNRIGADHSLRRGGAVSGVITDGHGSPAAGVAVSLRRLGARLGEGENMSGPGGRYSITDLAPGRYRMCLDDFQAIYDQQSVCLPGTITVLRGRVLRHVDGGFPPVPTIHVTVTDSSARPLSGVEVAGMRPCSDPYGCPAQPVFGPRNVAVDAIGMTDEHGSADLPLSRSGRYAVCALGYYAATPVAQSPTGYADKCTGSTFTLTVSRTSPASATISLDPGAVITGRVTNSAGDGVRRAQIHVTGSPVDDLAPDPFGFAYDSGPSPYLDSLTDGHGRYTIRAARPGQATLCARHAKGYRDGCLGGTQTLTGGAVTTAPRLVLSPGSSAHFAVPRARTRRPTEQVVVLDGRVVTRRSLPSGHLTSG